MGPCEGRGQSEEAQGQIRGGGKVFYDPLSATFTDPDSSRTEERLITVGHSSSQRLLVVVHTEQDGTIRIISARPATARERKRHEA